MNDRAIASSVRRRKVVRIIARLNVGGPAQQVCFLHENLSDEFETVLIAGQLDHGEADMSHLLSCADRVYWIKSLSRAIMPWSDAAALWRIYKILRRERPDIVHTHTAKAGTLGRIAALLAGVPCKVHTYHGNVFRGYFRPAASRFFLEIERALAHVTNKIIVVSDTQRDEVVDDFRVASREKVAVIRNGFDLHQLVRTSESGGSIRDEYGISADKVVVTWAGRMVPIKGIDILCELVRSAVPDERLHFLVVGDGPLSDFVKQQIGSLPNVTLAGWTKEMARVWSGTDIALLTSRNEGTPTAMIEAMAFGKPFVATNVGGVRDLAAGSLLNFEFGIEAANGFLPATDVKALLGCIQLLASHPTKASEMGNSGRELVFRDFCCDRLASDMRRLYGQLLAQPSIQPVDEPAVHLEA